MHIALATCHELPDWEVDDLPLHRALHARGVHLAQPAWNDPTTDWSAFDAVLIRTTWDYWHHRQAFVDWADHVDGCSRLFNGASVIRWNTDKRYLRQLSTAGVPIAPTVWLEQGARVDVAGLLAQQGWSHGFIKPVVGASASDTFRFSHTNTTPAQDHLDALLQRQGAMLQPYLPRVETDGEFSAIVIDGVVSHGVRKVPVPGDYRVQDDYGASDAPHALTPSEASLVEQACQAAMSILGLKTPLLYARVDWLRGEGSTVFLNELELVEPSLFFRHGPATAKRLADALVARVHRTFPT